MSNLAPIKSDLLKKQIAKDSIELTEKQIKCLSDALNREFGIRIWLTEHDAPEILIKRSNDMIYGFEKGIERLEKLKSSLVEIYPDELDPFTETLLQDIDKIPYSNKSINQ